MMPKDAEIPFQEQVAVAVPWLFTEYGFVMVWYECNPKVFGNAMVILKSPHLLVRFNRDRSLIDIDFARREEPDQWWEMSLLREASTGDPARLEPTLAASVAYLKDHLQELLDALGPRYSETMARVGEIRTRRLAGVVRPRKGQS